MSQINQMKRDMKNIGLIGFMATGKSIIGKALVDRLGDDYEFIETDSFIEEKAGKPIPRIFSEDGEIKFRELEINVFKNISTMQKRVISCGGGAVMNKINMDYLKINSTVVLLTASKDEIMRRILKDGKEKRPKVDKQEFVKEVEELLNYREPFYLAHADIIVDTTAKSVKSIVDEILAEPSL